MTLREKIYHLMSLTLTPFDKAIEALTGEFRNDLAKGFAVEALPPELEEAVTAIGAQLRADADKAREAVADVYQARFTEAEIDHQIAFHDCEHGRRLNEIGPAVLETVGNVLFNWRADAIKTAEPILTKLLGTGQPEAIEKDVPKVEIVEPPPAA